MDRFLESRPLWLVVPGKTKMSQHADVTNRVSPAGAAYAFCIQLRLILTSSFTWQMHQGDRHRPLPFSIGYDSRMWGILRSFV